MTPGIFLKLLVAYVKGSVNIEFKDKNLSEMLDKNYIYSEHGETFYINGFPIQGSTTKIFITTQGRKVFWKGIFKVILPSFIGIVGILVTVLKLLIGN
ncbi:hypothetical protein NGB30_01605 [Mammaliicoccus fleurettii]|uniref:hypothetical protein n=1 Tax=Mammaliicoccus fleurettii TaxID=150056 RepID=UPI002DBF284A|nr:hypothetical protein [Mammaliicoccus fleurettii]MEB7779227.1 hypothetical protein [Mammaliicoccus fleurettii]